MIRSNGFRSTTNAPKARQRSEAKPSRLSPTLRWREAWARKRPLGVEGESEIQKTNRAWATLDAVVALFTGDWMGMDGEAPDPVAVSLGLIDCDDEIQVRVASTDDKRVANYAARMQAGDDFPPLVLFFDRDGEDWHPWLADGFNRYQALLCTMDYTARATIYAGSRRDAEEYAATCNAHHGLPLSKADKREASRRLPKPHPEWSDRESARCVGASHPTAGKVRGTMEAKASSEDYQMPKTCVVIRGDQTYKHAPPEQDEAPDAPDYVPVWTLERGLRAYLDGCCDDNADRIAEVADILHRRDYERVAEHLAGSRRERDIVQALNNVLEQPRQRVESRNTLPQAEGPLPAPGATPQPTGGFQHIKQAFGGSDGRELCRMVADHPPNIFTNALRAVFARGSGAEWRAATSCLIETIEWTQSPGSRNTGGKRICPDCGERVIHISANGRRARDICIACGTVADIEVVAE